MGELKAIWLKRAKRGPMDPVPSAQLEKKKGLLDDANRSTKRQITIIEEEKWEAMMAELGGALPPSARRANLMVAGNNTSFILRKYIQIFSQN